MRIAVTGANGQLGREVCRQVGAAAVPLTRKELDLRDPATVHAVILQLKPDLVVNCAAYTQVDQAEKEPEAARAVNALSVAELARACRALDIPLVQVSTDYVFGGPLGLRKPHSESEPTHPQGVYAQTKLEGEQAAATHGRHWIVRTCGLYAEPGHVEAKNFVKTMLRLGAAGRPLRIVADQFCTPSYVPHVARAILFLARADRSGAAGRPAYGVYHVVNSGSTNWFEFAAEVFRLAEMPISLGAISSAEYAAPAPRPSYSVLDTSRYEALGGPVMPSWQAALAEYFQRRREMG
jgi:dTDP-4-dehydrorhamnose reductase